MNNFITYNHEYKHKLKTVFIGCGGHAQRNVYPTFQFAPVDLAAVCDLNSSAAEACARQFGGRRTYTDHREMLEKEKPDVAFIVTSYDENSNPRYPKLSIDCMKAGAHAWIEKPPASCTAEIRKMMRVSAETKKHVGVGFKKMFFPANQKAYEISHRPDFGAISSITARYPLTLPPLEERRDSAKMQYFLDHMVHPHSVLKYLAGEIESIFVLRHEITCAALVSLRFKSGAIGSLHFSAGQSGQSPFERTEIVGSGENVIVDNNILVTYFRKQAEWTPYGRGGNAFAAGIESAPLTWEPDFSLGQLYNKGLFLLGYAPEIIDFTTGLLEGKGPKVGSLKDALELMKLYEAYQKPDGQIVLV